MSARTAILGGLAFLVCLVGFVWVAWLVSQPGIPPIDIGHDRLPARPREPDPRRAHERRDLPRVEPRARGVRGACRRPSRRPEDDAWRPRSSLSPSSARSFSTTGSRLLVQRPRPGFDWAEVWPETSFPSGHSMDSFVVYLAFALLIWRLGGRRVGIVALVLAIALVVSVGISRIYLGAHWLSDVIGGYLAGALWLLLLVAAWALVSRLRTRESPRRRARGWGSAARAVPTRSVTPMGPGRRP